MNLPSGSPTPLVNAMPEHDERLAIRCLWESPRHSTSSLPAGTPACGATPAAWRAATTRPMMPRRGVAASGARSAAAEDPSRIRAWIFGIARRVLMDCLRARYSAPPLADVELDALEGTVIDDTDLRARIDDMESALVALPVVERDVLALFYLDELSLAEVASIAAVPIGTVKSRLFRARNLLRAALEPAPRNR